MQKSTGIFICALFALGLAGCGKEESSGAAPAVTAPVTNAANHAMAVSYTHLRAHETVLDLVCRLLLDKKKYTH